MFFNNYGQLVRSDLLQNIRFILFQLEYEFIFFLLY